MPIQPIKIPQNVYIEDRIVGPLTLKQILIVGVGTGFSYVLYGMLTKAYGALPLPATIMVWIPAGIAAVFAFVRINDISMFRLMLLTIERLNKPSIRVLTPRRGITINIRTFSTPETQTSTLPSKADSSTVQFEELSSILDRSVKQKESAAEPLSPLEENPEFDEHSPETALLPVDPSRITASAAMPGPAVDTVTPPSSGTVSLFRDISPRT